MNQENAKKKVGDKSPKKKRSKREVTKYLIGSAGGLFETIKNPSENILKNLKNI